jgi:antitoxin Phd
MNSWPVQDAEARFSELLDAALKEGPQMVTRRGAEVAVLVPIAEWKRLRATSRPTLKELLLADGPRADILTPQAGAVAAAFDTSGFIRYFYVITAWGGERCERLIQRNGEASDSF